jgi:Ras-related protein Rab-1A
MVEATDAWSAIFQPGEKNSQQAAMNIGLVGVAGVGKTSIVRKFVDPNKPIDTKNTMTTIGVDQYTYYLRWQGENIKIKIWDTAGQERFATLTNSYLKPLDGVLLVFAFDSKESIEQTCKWRDNIRTVKELPMVLVGNKCDLPNK